MYKIAICEDNDDDVTYFKKMIEAVDVLDKNELGIYSFSSGEQFCFSDWIAYDLVIIDIQLGEEGKMNGYKTAMKLREIDSNFLLVFCSGSVMPFCDSYKANPYRYLRKGLADHIMIDEMREIMLEVKRRKALPGIFCKLSSKEKIKVYPKSIIYIAKGRNCSEVHITKELMEKYSVPVLKCSMKLDEINDTFDEACDFIRPHNSYIVNMSCIVSVNDNVLEFQNGEKLKCSKSKTKEFNRVFARYLTAKYARK